MPRIILAYPGELEYSPLPDPPSLYPALEVTGQTPGSLFHLQAYAWTLQFQCYIFITFIVRALAVPFTN